MKCKGRTKSGKQCKREVNGSEYCHLHSPESAAGGDSEFTDKEWLFICEYPVDCNGAAAARRAGYAKDSARVTASRLLSKANIRAAIEERLEEQAMSANEVLARLTRIARGSLEPFINTETAKPCVDLTGEDAQAALDLLKEVQIDEDGEIKLKIHDPMAALVHLGKAHGVFVDRVEHTGKDGAPLAAPFDYSKLSDEALKELKAAAKAQMNKDE